MTARNIQGVKDHARAAAEHLAWMHSLAMTEPAIREHVVLAMTHLRSAERYLDALPTCRSCGDVLPGIHQTSDAQCSDCARFEQSRRALVDALLAAGEEE